MPLTREEQDYIHSAGNPPDAGNPYIPVPAQSGKCAQEASSVAQHRILHCHGGAVLLEQQGIVRGVYQVHFPYCTCP